MTAIIFAGPSLGDAAAELSDDIVLRPPARQGDVFLAARRRPRAIGLIDGYFEGVPSVWHKEILFALGGGIAVYGSASMGALRAAELDVFGMIGIGRIYEDFRDGVIDADDEVALLHGPSETGFVALTEPLVNVRATCRAALAAAVLYPQDAETLLAAAKTLFYKERTWPRIFRDAAACGLAEASCRRVESWLAAGRVDQKRDDARAMIERMVADREKTRRQPGFAFESTFLWERAVAGWLRHPRAYGPHPPERLYWPPDEESA